MSIKCKKVGSTIVTRSISTTKIFSPSSIQRENISTIIVEPCSIVITYGHNNAYNNMIKDSQLKNGQYLFTCLRCKCVYTNSDLFTKCPIKDCGGLTYPFIIKDNKKVIDSFLSDAGKKIMNGRIVSNPIHSDITKHRTGLPLPIPST